MFTVGSSCWQFNELGIKNLFFVKEENCFNNDEDYEDEDDVDEDIFINNKSKHILYYRD